MDEIQIREKIAKEILEYSVFMATDFKNRADVDSQAFMRGFIDGYHHASEIALNTKNKRQILDKIAAHSTES